MKLPWPHAYRNAIMAASVALYLGASPEVVKQVAVTFRGLPQRLELRGSKNGIAFYNDSGSTNPHSTLAAIYGFSKPVVLIMGGKDRGVSYRAVKEAIKGSCVSAVVLYGENKRKIQKEIKSVAAGVPIRLADTLEGAVKTAYEFARKSQKSPEEWAILFSPGAASFDMFKNSFDRGRKFNAIVKRYLK